MPSTSLLAYFCWSLKNAVLHETIGAFLSLWLNDVTNNFVNLTKNMKNLKLKPTLTKTKISDPIQIKLANPHVQIPLELFFTCRSKARTLGPNVRITTTPRLKSRQQHQKLAARTVLKVVYPQRNLLTGLAEQQNYVRRLPLLTIAHTHAQNYQLIRNTVIFLNP